MPFPPSDHRITLDQARELTRRFRMAQPGGVKAGALWKEPVQQLLSQPGCVALRIYFGINQSGERTLLLVGVNEQEEDMTEGQLLNIIFLCPPFCNETSPLNR